MKNRKEITFVIEGTPKAQKRHRFGRGYIYDPSKKEKQDIRALVGAINLNKTEDAVTIAITFYMPRPKKHYRTGKYAGILKETAPDLHTSKPDLDNMIKFYMDALNGLAWKDDAQVVGIMTNKIYDETPRTEITIHNHSGSEVIEYPMDNLGAVA